MDTLLNYNQISELIEPRVTYTQLSAILNVPVKTLQYWVHAGYMPCEKLGNGRKGLVRFRVSDVTNWLNTRRINGRKDFRNPLS